MRGVEEVSRRGNDGGEKGENVFPTQTLARAERRKQRLLGEAEQGRNPVCARLLDTGFGWHTVR